MSIVKAGVLYFCVVFGVGFVLGLIRIMWAVPRFGERVSELMETPLMLVVIVLSARWVVARSHTSAAPKLAALGLVALVLLVAAEFIFVLSLRGLSIPEYIASRDPVSGGVYVMSLLLFAAMPVLVRRWAV